MSSWTQLSEAIVKVKPGTPVTLTVDGTGSPVTLHTTLASVPGHGGYLGVAPGTVFQRQSFARLGQVRRHRVLRR